MKTLKEKLLLRSIAASFVGMRNISNFSKSEYEFFIILFEEGKVRLEEDERKWSWARLTSRGINRLHELNRRRDIVDFKKAQRRGVC
jgi:hypothetical protein